MCFFLFLIGELDKILFNPAASPAALLGCFFGALPAPRPLPTDVSYGMVPLGGSAAGVSGVGGGESEAITVSVAVSGAGSVGSTSSSIVVGEGVRVLCVSVDKRAFILSSWAFMAVSCSSIRAFCCSISAFCCSRSAL